MVEVAGRKRKRPGLTRRMARSTLQVGMLATAVLVGRKTAGGRARDGQGTGGSGGPEAPGGLGAAAGGGPGASHETDPREVANGDHGRQADVPQEIPPRGWKDIAKRTAKEVKQDQVPLLGAGVAFYALLSLFPAIIAGVSIYGLVADPETVQDQISQLTEMLSPETATIVGTSSSRSPAGPAAPSGWPPSSGS